MLDLPKLINLTKLSDADALLVFTFVSENLYNHDDFQRFLIDLGMKNKL